MMPLLRILPVHDSNVVWLELDGALASDEIERVASHIERVGERQSGLLRLYAELSSDARAPVSDELRALALGRHHGCRFERAVVVGKRPHSNCTAAAIAPGVESRAFEPRDRHLALAWLAS
ncbi:MAG: STAS/SEC14 domain-containing protein [Pseudomonadota bacterium]